MLLPLLPFIPRVNKGAIYIQYTINQSIQSLLIAQDTDIMKTVYELSVSLFDETNNFL
jgi:hypothetical protein